MTIRKAVPSDAPVIADFNLALAEETEGLHLTPAVVAAGVAAILADPAKGIYFVAEQQGDILGQVMITYEWSDWRNGNLWWLQSVYVRPDMRRRGIFRRLFRHLQDEAAAQRDVCGLRLYMHSENNRARLSYENLGFRNSPYDVFELELETRIDRQAPTVGPTEQQPRRHTE